MDTKASALAPGGLTQRHRGENCGQGSVPLYPTLAPASTGQILTHGDTRGDRVTGANLGQPLGIVMLNAEAAARANDPAARTALDLSLTQHLHSVNQRLDPHEHLSCLVVTKAWPLDKDLITPTFKVKRNRIEDLYSSQYLGWEALGRQVIWPMA